MYEVKLLPNVYIVSYKEFSINSITQPKDSDVDRIGFISCSVNNFWRDYNKKDIEIFEKNIDTIDKLDNALFTEYFKQNIDIKQSDGLIVIKYDSNKIIPPKKDYIVSHHNFYTGERIGEGYIDFETGDTFFTNFNSKFNTPIDVLKLVYQTDIPIIAELRNKKYLDSIRLVKGTKKFVFYISTNKVLNESQTKVSTVTNYGKIFFNGKEVEKRAVY